MAQGGKFSHPRPHRDEERQIEQAFRQITGQEPAPQKPIWSDELPIEPKFPQSTTATQVPDETAQIEQAFQQVTGQRVTPKAPPQPAVKPKAESFDLLPDDMEAFFDQSTGRGEMEPEYNDDPDFIDKLLAFWNKTVDFCSKNQKVVLITLCAVAIAFIGIFITVFVASTRDPYGDKILSNVIIADVNVGGMTKNEAVSAVKAVTDDTYTKEDMVIDLSGIELRLSPKDTDAALNVKSAVDEAFDYGRTGTQEKREQAEEDSRTKEYVIGLLPHLQLDEDYILKTLTGYAEDSGSTLTQPTYGLEGTEPELSADKFDENAPCQTLVITLGTPGIGFDAKDVYEQVLDAYSQNRFLVTVDDVEETKDPDPVDLEAIYREFYVEPVDATINKNTSEAKPGSYGYGFDLPTAQKLVDEAEFGETVRIPMEYIAPEILDADAFFRDTLGEYQSRTTNHSDRTTNLRLACQAIHDTVLMPGESFSFSSQLNNSRGYKTAPEDTGLDPSAQGGVSQVASALYCAALVSDLEIVSRSAHSYIPSFVDSGLDATASLKLRNSTAYPIRIEAEVTGGYVKVSIIGTEERDYYIVLDSFVSETIQPETEYVDFIYNNSQGYKDGDVIQEGTEGHEVKSFKVKYSSTNGKKLSSDWVATTKYPGEKQIVARVEPEPTTGPTTEPTTEATEPPTRPTVPPETTRPPETTAPPETSAPTETTVPPTEPTVPSTTPATTPAEVPAGNEAAAAETVSGSDTIS